MASVFYRLKEQFRLIRWIVELKSPWQDCWGTEVKEGRVDARAREDAVTAAAVLYVLGMFLSRGPSLNWSCCLPARRELLPHSRQPLSKPKDIMTC